MLEKRRIPELVPRYSLTGDLLSFLRCGLLYRYQNGSALPPSRPVQVWFGEFIHGVMETAYRMWLEGARTFPWPCNPSSPLQPPPSGRAPHDIGSIGELVETTLSAAGKTPRSRTLRESAYQRAELAVNHVGPHLFPLIVAAEEKVIGTRELQPVAGAPMRARMYELHGIMDVLSSVSVASAAGNVIREAVRRVCTQLPPDADIIVDYKGSRRPPTAHPYWEQGGWQLQTYAWLRSRQSNTRPVAAGVLLYINELAPAADDLTTLLREMRDGGTDIVPAAGSPDAYQLNTWRPGAEVPTFSLDFRMARMIRVVPITEPSMNAAIAAFDEVVRRIESCVAQEAAHGDILRHWPAEGDEPTCDACDFRHFCPAPAQHRRPGYVPGAPNAP
ncbi:PD-(D/E)XK nuclease family protein [Archangium gephyra]|uniref:PD-(D/E)XK nuclease family protein n=1 Tax=Archangium gephyra TaxID=48 RepID=UPI0035D3ED53